MADREPGINKHGVITNMGRWMKVRPSKLLWIPRSLLIFVGILLTFAIVFLFDAPHAYDIIPPLAWNLLFLFIFFVVSFFQPVICGISLILYAIILIRIYEIFAYIPMGIVIIAGILMIFFHYKSTKIHW